MTVSKYFKHISAKNEQDLITDLTVETIQQRGLDLMYIPREASEEGVDYLFGEDTSNSFKGGKTVEMYPKNMTGFEGEGEFMASFGMDIRDEAEFQISRKRFEDVITKAFPHITRPREGDLISYAMAKAVFEITFVEHEQPFYIIGKSHTYDFMCKRYEYSHEVIEDNDENSDRIPTFEEPTDSPEIQTESDTFVNFDEDDPFSDNNY